MHAVGGSSAEPVGCEFAILPACCCNNRDITWGHALHTPCHTACVVHLFPGWQQQVSPKPGGMLSGCMCPVGLASRALLLRWPPLPALAGHAGGCFSPV